MAGFLLLVASCLLASPCFANRAFPVDSQNFANDLFQDFNPVLEWDSTNELVDLSGPVTGCHIVGNRGTFVFEGQTYDGDSVGGVRDYIRGGRSDANAVKGYIRSMLPAWTRDYSEQLKTAKRFGCSVRPACDGNAVVACLFSPGQGQSEEEYKVQYSKAFTPAQYLLAEDIMGSDWDRSHLLENLSGYETQCAMLEQASWPFTHMRDLAEDRHIPNLYGVYGNSQNLGSTPFALEDIMMGFMPTFDKLLSSAPAESHIGLGCSVIPDCMRGSEMYVVVACILRT